MIRDRATRYRIPLAIVILLAAAIGIWWLLSDRTYQTTPQARRSYLEGVAALRDGASYKASKALDHAVALDPRFALAHARLAEVYLELDLTGRAKEEMLRAAAPAASPRLTRAERKYTQALQLTLAGDVAGAAVLYRDLAVRAPSAGKADAYLDLGRACERNDKTSEALDAYLEATRLAPRNPAAWLRLAMLSGRQMNQASAAQAFERAEKLYHETGNLEGATEAMYQRGVLAGRLGQGEQARALLTQALEIAGRIGSLSQEIPALLELSASECRSSQFAQAQADAAKAIDLARVNGLEVFATRGLVDLGNAYFLMGDADEPRRLYTQSLDYARRSGSERNQARALFSLGSLAMRYGDTGEALQSLGQAVDWFQRAGYRKEAADALVLLARAQRQKGDYEGTLQAFEQQRKIGAQLGDDSLTAQAEQGRGTVLAGQGRLPEALAAFRDAFQAARKSTEHVEAQYDLLYAADVYWRLGRYREALQALADGGTSTSRAVSELHDQIRAAMALSEGDFPKAMEFSARVLSQRGVSAELTVAAKGVLGRAKLSSGARAEGVALVNDAARLASKSGDPLLIADARLAQAEVLLDAGDAHAALDAALAAQRLFAAAANREGEWRSWLAAADAESVLRDANKSREDAQKAAQLLAELGIQWESENYKTYLWRPDIQLSRDHLSGLIGAR